MAWPRYSPTWVPKGAAVPYRFTDEQLDKIEEMAMFQCTATEIAHYFQIHRDTFRRMCRDDPEIDRRIILGQSRGKRALRAAQFRVALSGNCTMLMFLGQAILGQNPNANVTMSGGELTVNGVSEEQKQHLMALARHLDVVAKLQESAPESESGSAVMDDLGHRNGNGAHH